MTAVTYYGRIRFIFNFLPLLRQATGLRHVVTVVAGGKEGKLYEDDLDGRKVPLAGLRGNGYTNTTLTLETLTLETLARQAPDVSFNHNFPGQVETNLLWSEAGGT